MMNCVSMHSLPCLKPAANGPIVNGSSIRHVTFRVHGTDGCGQHNDSSKEAHDSVEKEACLARVSTNQISASPAIVPSMPACLDGVHLCSWQCVCHSQNEWPFTKCADARTFQCCTPEHHAQQRAKRSPTNTLAFLEISPTHSHTRLRTLFLRMSAEKMCEPISDWFMKSVHNDEPFFPL